MPIISPGGSGGAASTLGSSLLIYRYTVSGASKASIDTGADTPQAGANDWTNCDLIEVYLSGQTAAASVQDSVNITLNNDGGAHYDRQYVQGANATASAATVAAGSAWVILFRGSSGLASQAGNLCLWIPNPTGTTFNKSAHLISNAPDSTAANQAMIAYSLGFRSTAAVTRLAVAGGGGNLAVGTVLAIYKRLAA